MQKQVGDLGGIKPADLADPLSSSKIETTILYLIDRLLGVQCNDAAAGLAPH